MAILPPATPVLPYQYDTHYTFDSHGRPERIKYPDDTTEQWTRDERGNAKQYTDRRNFTTTYTYEYESANPQGQDSGTDDLLVIDHPGNLADTVYEYHPEFHFVTKESSGTQVVREAGYTSLGQLAWERDQYGQTNYAWLGLALSLKTDPLGFQTGYTYDSHRRLSQVADHQGLIQGYQTTYAYDAYGNVDWVQDNRGNTTQFLYDAVNRLVETQQLGWWPPTMSTMTPVCCCKKSLLPGTA